MPLSPPASRRAFNHAAEPPSTWGNGVAHLTTAHPSTDNRIFRKEVASLHRAGIPICLIAPAESDAVVDGVPILKLPQHSSRLRRMLQGQVNALRILRRVKPKVLHIHDPELIPLAVFHRRTSGTRVIFDAHEDLPKQIWAKPYIPQWAKPAVSRLARGLEFLADREFDGIVTATPSIKRNFKNRRTVAVNNFPWLSDFPEPTPFEEAPAASYAYVGSLSAARGAREMVSAVEGRPHAHLAVAGPVLADAESDVATSDSVSYLGKLPPSDVPGVVSGARAGFVLFHPLPNHLECQPTKLFEYMAAERPFIASDFFYWRALLGEDSGLFVDPVSVSSIQQAMEWLESNPEEAARMGKAGRRLVQDRFTFESQAELLVELTCELLS